MNLFNVGTKDLYSIRVFFSGPLPKHAITKFAWTWLGRCENVDIALYPLQRGLICSVKVHTLKNLPLDFKFTSYTFVCFLCNFYSTGNMFLRVQMDWVVIAIKTVTLLWQPAKSKRDIHVGH